MRRRRRTHRATRGDLVENIVGCLRPYERPWVVVPVGEPGADIAFEYLGRAVDAALELLLCELGEPIWRSADTSSPDAGGPVIVGLDGVPVLAHSEKQNASANREKSGDPRLAAGRNVPDKVQAQSAAVSGFHHGSGGRRLARRVLSLPSRTVRALTISWSSGA